MLRATLVASLILFPAGLARGADPASASDLAATFSIAAYDPDAQEWGVAVASKYLAVGSACPWAAAGSGAVATQALVNATLGPRGLSLMGDGKPADAVLAALAESDKGWDHRQVGLVDASGKTAAWTGPKCHAWAGHKSGPNFTCQGNLLAGPEVIDGMAHAFTNAKGPLAWRMMAALEAAEKAGGDRRGKQSAAIIVVKSSAGPNGLGDRMIDLRVDDHKGPVQELARLLELRLPR